MYKIFSDIAFMCRTYTKIQARSILVLLLEQVRTLGRAKARLGKRQIIRKRLVHLDDYLQQAGPLHWMIICRRLWVMMLLILLLLLLVVVVFRSGEEEKSRRKWRKTFGEGKLMVTPTNRQGEYSAICLFKVRKIEGRDLQFRPTLFENWQHL